jgi:hypothetical protein
MRLAAKEIEMAGFLGLGGGGNGGGSSGGIDSALDAQTKTADAKKIEKIIGDSQQEMTIDKAAFQMRKVALDTISGVVAGLTAPR